MSSLQLSNRLQCGQKLLSFCPFSVSQAASCVSVLLWLQVRANVVALTLDMAEEELHFQFAMNNWSSYVDQV